MTRFALPHHPSLPSFSQFFPSCTNPTFLQPSPPPPSAPPAFAIVGQTKKASNNSATHTRTTHPPPPISHTPRRKRDATWLGFSSGAKGRYACANETYSLPFAFPRPLRRGWPHSPLPSSLSHPISRSHTSPRSLSCAPPLTRLCRYPTRDKARQSFTLFFSIVPSTPRDPNRALCPTRQRANHRPSHCLSGVTFISTQDQLNQRTPGRSPRYFSLANPRVSNWPLFPSWLDRPPSFFILSHFFTTCSKAIRTARVFLVAQTPKTATPPTSDPQG